MKVYILITDTYRGGIDVNLFKSEKELFDNVRNELSDKSLKHLKDYQEVVYGEKDSPSTMRYEYQEI